MVQPHNHPNCDSPFLLPRRGDLIWRVKLVPGRAAELQSQPEPGLFQWSLQPCPVSTLILISLDAVTLLELFSPLSSPLASWPTGTKSSHLLGFSHHLHSSLGKGKSLVTAHRPYTEVVFLFYLHNFISLYLQDFLCTPQEFGIAWKSS